MRYKAFHKLTYGLYIIASDYNGKKSGYIANTAFQVTSEPSQIGISCHKENLTEDVIRKSGAFSISVLKRDLDTSVIGLFGFMSGEDIDKFSSVSYKIFSTGAPVVTEASVAWFECRVVREIDLGTHTFFIGEVVGADILSDEPPLTYDYYREKYRMLSPKHSPTYIEKEKLEKEEPLQPEKETGESTGKSSWVEDKKDVTVTARSYTCTICGYTYDPEVGDPTVGIPPGTPFEDLPDDYKCPICNASKDLFR